MSVILLILKVIGMILLVLLGILILLLVLVLFVPVRYRVSGAMEEKLQLKGQVTWLLHLLSFKFLYEDGEFSQTVRICGIRLKAGAGADDEEDTDFEESEFEPADIDSMETEPEPADIDSMETELAPADIDSIETAADDAGRKTEPEQKSETMDTADGKTESEQKSETTDTDGGKAGPEQKSETADDAGRKTESEQKSETADTDGRKTESESVDSDSMKMSFFENIKHAFRQFRKKLLQLKKSFSDIKNILTDETNKKAVSFVWQEILYLLQHFRFRKLRTELSFSIGDPALTGQTLGILSMLPFLYRYECQIYPDFEADKLYVKGTFNVKGHVRFFHFVKSAFGLWRKKEVRTVIKKIIK